MELVSTYETKRVNKRFLQLVHFRDSSQLLKDLHTKTLEEKIKRQ